MPGTEDSVEDMLKFIYVILMNLFRAPYMIPKMHKEADHPEKYSEEERYELARHVIRLMKTTGGIWSGKSPVRGRLYDVSKPSGKV